MTPSRIALLSFLLAIACQPSSRSTDEPRDEQMCADDQQQCPDGSMVRRVGPDCAFEACPGDRTGTPMEDEMPALPPMEPVEDIPDEDVFEDEPIPPGERPSDEPIVPDGGQQTMPPETGPRPEMTPPPPSGSTASRRAR